MAKERPVYAKWYFNDWFGDRPLQLCSLLAHGQWINMLGIMTGATPYGHLAVDGRPMSDEELLESLPRRAFESPGGDVSPLTVEQVSQILAELDGRGVFSRTESGVIYSRRLVRDEAVWQSRSTSGQKGGKTTGRLLKRVSKWGLNRSSEALAQANCGYGYGTGSGSGGGTAAPPLSAKLDRDEGAWKTALGLLAEQIDEENFETWVEPLVYLGVADGVAHLMAPSDHVRSWIDRFYREAMVEAMGDAIKGVDVHVAPEEDVEDDDGLPDFD